MLRTPIQALVAVLALLLAAVPVSAQATGAQGAPSLRPYWHVFIAYAIAIVLVLAWVISISRRLRQVEERLHERP